MIKWPIERLLAAFQDPDIVELIINGDGSVYVERCGAVLEKLADIATPAQTSQFLKAVAGDFSLDAKRPYADLSASDGSRVHVMAPPVARGGLTVTIRKRPARRPSLQELTRSSTLTQPCADFLKFAVEQRKNILIVGGMSSGKTTMLNALCGVVGQHDRIIVLEETPELTLPQPHVVYLRTSLEVTMREVLRNTLRMRPDRILVGEVRGPEALDMLQAMNIGQEGVMCTLHANSPREALQRLETLVLMAGLDMPLKAVRGNVALALDLLVFIARLSDGSRRVAQVSEVTGLEGENVLLNDLFTMENSRSPLRATGSLPRFFDQLRQQGLELPIGLFK